MTVVSIAAYRQDRLLALVQCWQCHHSWHQKVRRCELERPFQCPKCHGHRVYVALVLRDP